MKFDELNIDERILRAVEDMGFEETSPIQTQAIPAVLEGIDVIGQAQTGTGKTAAYSIPMLQKINPDVKKPQAIVLCPTRELAVQVAEEIRKLAKYMSDIKVLPVYGGQEIVRQIKSLKAGVQIIVGTPGRVMDHMRRKTVKFDSVSMVILDEADEMLDMGFREDMETILTETPEERQTVLFSATMPKPIMEIARKFQKDAKIIKVVRKELTVSNIDQFYYEVRPKNKTEILSRLIDIYNPKLSVVFCNTKRQVDELISELKGRGYFADGIHGDMKQQQRDRVMDDFRSGKTEILIATDVAARGIDVDGVDIVFNYDLPQDEEYYVHRIGRTGRAGKSGLALSFISGREVYKLKDIERYCKTKILAKPIPSLDDVKNTKMDGIFDKIKEMIEADEHRAMLDMVEEHVNQEDYTSMDMAAALLKMIVGDTLDRIDEVENFHFDENADTSRMVRLFINVGKKDKITPANILGAIAGESGMPGRLVGAIDMMDNYTFVDVPAKHAEAVLAAMNDNVLIKGRKVNVEKANVSAKPARKSKSKPDTRRRKDESRGKHDKLKERRSKSGKVRRMEKSIKLTSLNRKEALRYLGYKKNAPDERVEELMDECEELVLKTAVPRFIYKKLDFTVNEDGVAFKNTSMVLPGESIKKHLYKCDSAICMAVTISEGIDRQLRVLQLTDMAKALVFDSLASVAVEQACDKVEELLREEYPDYYQTFRFGIGYGDLPISMQEPFLKVLDAGKKIGLNLNKSYMLAPVKSVTAVIGLTKEPVSTKNRGCATCNLNKTCAYRGMGGHCSG